MVFILVLVFGVLRPVLNNITGGGKQAAPDSDMELGGMMGLDGELANDRVSLGGPTSILLPSPSEVTRHSSTQSKAWWPKTRAVWPRS